MMQGRARTHAAAQESFASLIQGSLAHKKQPPPYGHHSTLGIVLL